MVENHTQDEVETDNENGFSRRRFLTTSGTLAGMGLFGGIGTRTVTAASADVGIYRNWRVREASKVWKRGYRGRPDRTIGLTDTGIEARHPDLGPWNGILIGFNNKDPDDDGDSDHPWSKPFLKGGNDPFADIDPANVTAQTPKVVGWYDANDQYGELGDAPRDQNGHGSHVSSIMAGSGRASAIDFDTVQKDEPHAILAAGDVLTYEVEAQAGTGVYASVYGEFIGLVIEGPDGQTLDRTDFQEGDATVIDDKGLDGSNIVADTPTVHTSGTATYTVYVRPKTGETVATGRAERVSVGAFLDPQETTGDRTAAGGSSVHSGLAPNQSLVGLGGLSDPTLDLGKNAEWFADTFNLRSINMSWGYLGGAPIGAGGGTLSFGVVEAIKKMAHGGILTVAAAGNSNTPANGNSAPAVADEAISVVSTGPFDGIVDYSSGGLGAVDEDELDYYLKPDVTAPGGASTDLINAAKNGDPSKLESEQPPIRDYIEKAGTSMASPYTNGIAGLVAQAMEFDAPDSIALPAPDETDFNDVMRLKQVLLTTASETVFTAAPYHKAHTPTYEFGGRDPYEGYGRVNPDAAVDAVSRELTGTTAETVGLYIPDDSRAVAGYVAPDPSVLEVSVDFSHLSGGNKDAAKGNPHIDLFVYDAEYPSEHGEPNIVAKAQGIEGNASVQFAAVETNDEGEITDGGTYYVVAKLVDIPGVFNSFDVQAHFDLSVETVTDLIVRGTRTDDGSAFTAGQTDQIDIEIHADTPVIVRDRVPREWDVLEEPSDVSKVVPAPDGQSNFVYFDRNGDGATNAEDATIDHSYTYFAEAPSETGDYEFGPVEVTTDVYKTRSDREWVAVSGTAETNAVVGQSTNA
ncbi:S8 family serine peptidase [Haladaptatus halobius]|uniref:S8 family serine peptidase n=1 Tax=Haladaptatus halobius TaxID=2884875 RepID=UPI001D0BA519|nr:S8 family serine peptidase [Haladaptatus halobius]